MTKKEAIKTLRELWRETNDSWYEEAYNMAIEALERTDTHECDSVSRQETLDACAVSYYASSAYTRIEALPSANKSGHWIHDTHYGLNLPEHKCSECGTWEYSDEDSNFCPNCGARMKGADDE